jgi:hypothetical protein
MYVIVKEHQEIHPSDLEPLILVRHTPLHLASWCQKWLGRIILDSLTVVTIVNTRKLVSKVTGSE